VQRHAEAIDLRLEFGEASFDFGDFLIHRLPDGA
jgi:hypothetical protein